MITEYYPCESLPSKLQNAVLGRIPEKPIKPIEPEKPKGRPVGDFFLLSLFWCPFLVIASILVCFSISFVFWAGILLGIIVAAVLSLILREKIVSAQNLVKTSEMKNRELSYNEEFAIFTKNLAKYKLELQEYEAATKAHALCSQEEFQRYLLSEYFKNYIPPVLVPCTIGEVKIGPAEKRFVLFLQTINMYGFELLENVKTKHVLPSGFEYYYYPDIVLREKSTGLLIDIEVDEPYIARKGTPIHYIDENNNRDDAMISDNWVVFRFAEEQIVKFPKDCISYVLSYVWRLIKGDKYGIPLLTFARNFKSVELVPFTNIETRENFKALRFKDKDGNSTLVHFSGLLGELSSGEITSLKYDLQIVPLEDRALVLFKENASCYADISMKRWSYAEALEMAKSNYRQSYLPEDLKNNVRVVPLELTTESSISIDDELPF